MRTDKYTDRHKELCDVVFDLVMERDMAKRLDISKNFRSMLRDYYLVTSSELEEYDRLKK